MADIAVRTVSYPTLTTATKPMIHVGDRPVDQNSCLSGEAITEGAPVRIDTATGKVLNALATTAPNAAVKGIALKTVAANQAVTIVSRGLIEGLNLDAIGYGAPVYLSNTPGRVADAAGTVSTIIGYVFGVRGDVPNAPMSKLLKVTL